MSTHPEQALDIIWFMSHGWKLWHSAGLSYLTDEANAEFAWNCERSEAPYCTNTRGSRRQWNGPTPEAAIRASLADLGTEYPALAALTPQAPQPSRSQRLAAAGYTRRPSWKSLPPDGDDDDESAEQPEAAQKEALQTMADEAQALGLGYEAAEPVPYTDLMSDSVTVNPAAEPVPAPVQPTDHHLVDTTERSDQSVQRAAATRAVSSSCFEPRHMFAGAIGALDLPSWPLLDKPAAVGNGRFGIGVSARLVVVAAQRLHEWEVTPEKEAERIARGAETMARLQEQIGLATSPVESVERDALRYRFLVERLGQTSLPVFIEAKLGADYVADGKDAIDAAIDAALAADREKQP